MGLKHLILGCLMDHPTYGYEMITSLYRDFVGLGPEVNDGQLYTTLNRMESEGLITKKVVHQEKVPNKKVIYITPKGREEFLEWLLSGEGENDPVRFDFFNKYEFLNKCNFFNHLDAGAAMDKLSAQHDLVSGKLENLLRARESMVRKGVAPFRIKILEYGIGVQKVKVKWLEEMMELFRGGKP
ncbi:MAG: helix-turn-helix transcriptional regulator [Bacillota bacterium]|jgi:DNA-binding PadR family transcriptional regulator